MITNRTDYLLLCLAEECAEVAQRASKCLRFGIDDIQEGQPDTSRERLASELDDLIAIRELLEQQGIIRHPSQWNISHKQHKVIDYMSLTCKGK